MSDNSPPDWLLNMPTRSEEIGFSPDQLKNCTACGKPNAPDRGACLYCGAAFDGVAAKLDLREVEGWENGFNIVAIRSSDSVDEKKAGAILGMDVETLTAILGSSAPLPIARVESEAIANDVTAELSDLGIEACVVADVKLAVITPPTRLRDISFEDDELALRLFNTGDVTRLLRDELVLIVAGVHLESRREATEKRKRGATKTLSETETSSDQTFLDLYSPDNSTGWRIPSSGFDFSCLGSEKSLLAGDNLRRLIQKLADFAPSAKLVDDYNDVRELLENIWPSERRRDAFGFQRSGFARKDLSSVATTNNQMQVNKYSRLQWHLL